MQEINYDYALTESSSSFEIVQCLCGKVHTPAHIDTHSHRSPYGVLFLHLTFLASQAKCRGRITGNDWQLPELQERYGDHFLPYINDLIRASKQQQSTQ